MSYIRVIPRDLFNEADLLKCLGKLWIGLEGRTNASLEQEDEGSPFDIQQTVDGGIYVSGLTLTIKGEQFDLWRPLNSRQPYPLWAVSVDDGTDDFLVLNEDGSLSADLLALLGDD